MRNIPFKPRFGFSNVPFKTNSYLNDDLVLWNIPFQIKSYILCEDLVFGNISFKPYNRIYKSLSCFCQGNAVNDFTAVRQLQLILMQINGANLVNFNFPYLLKNNPKKKKYGLSITNNILLVNLRNLGIRNKRDYGTKVIKDITNYSLIIFIVFN